MSNLIGVKNHDSKPKRRDDLRDQVYESWEILRESEPAHRRYLGASDIGNECARAVWYTFYHAKRKRFPGRVLRLFDRGHREEETIEKELQRIGMPITTIGASGGQHHFEAMYGHSRVHLDGIVEFEGKRFVVEMKTMSKAQYAKMDKNGVKKAKPEYYSQMQYQLFVADQNGETFDGALFIAVCKDNDEWYCEEVDVDHAHQKMLQERAENIVIGEAPPPLTGSPNSGACRWCDFKEICRENLYHEIEHNCRTCEFGKTTDNAGWTCTAGRPFGTPCDAWAMKKEF